MTRPLISAAALCILAGCATVPSTEIPPVATPATWTMSGAITSPAAATAPWWRQFDDAAMNAVIEAALSANGDLETARARVLEARAMRQGAAARLRPQLDVGTEIARRDETESTRPSNSATAQLEARWDADLFGANRRTLEAREALLGAAEADADGVALALAIETARSYVDLREAQQRLAIARRNLSAQRETLALTRARQAAGIASLLDVSQAETLALATESALPALEAQAKAAIRRLESLTAVAPGALDPALAGEKPVPRASFPRALETPANVIAQRPDLRIAERRLAAFNAERAAAEAARYPSLILRAVFGVRALSPETIMTPSQTVWSIAGGLAAPLFDAGRIEAEVRAADARTMQAAAQYRQRVVDAFGEVESALALLVGAENERTALVRTAASSAETRALAEMRYRRGLAGFIDVLDAQRAVYQAEDRLSASEAATARRIIGLHAALGSPATNSMSRVATAAWQ